MSSVVRRGEKVLRNQLVGKVLYSEIALFVFVFAMMTIGYSRTYAKVSNLFGVLMVVVWVVEFFLLKKKVGSASRRSFRIYPLWGTVVLAMIMALMLLFSLGNFRHLVTFIQVLVLMVVVYNIIRSATSTWSVCLGMFMGVLAMFLLASDDIVRAAASGTRYRLSVGGDSYGLNPNLYGSLLNLQILLYLRFVFVDMIGVRRDRMVMALLLLGGLATIVSSYQILTILGSRQNQLWLMTSIFGILFLGGKGRIRIGTIAISALFVFLLSSVAFALARESAYFDRFVDLYYDITTGSAAEDSGYSRMNMIKIGIDLWVSNPIFGYGPDGFRENSGLGQYSHNQYIELLVNYGLLGFLSFYSVHCLIIGRAYRMWWLGDRKQKANSIWIVVAVVGLLISNMFQPSYLQKSFALIVAVLVGVVYQPWKRKLVEQEQA